jgi:hypothetical protein
MKSGMLTSWYASKVFKAKNPVEYTLALQEFLLYQAKVFNFNMKEYFSLISDK